MTMLKNLLIYRWLLINSVIAGVLVLPAASGHAARLFTEDTSLISYGIAALFALAWLWNAREVFRVSLRRNELFRLRADARAAHPSEGQKAMAKLAWLNQVPEWLVGLGLLGTVLGFKVALGAVDQGSLANAGGVQTSITTLMQGVTIAINTTIVGAVTGLWLEVNNRLLRTAAETYWADRS
jgi:biopolymer transport protein ExbB/TolQ